MYIIFAMNFKVILLVSSIPQKKRKKKRPVNDYSPFGTGYMIWFKLKKTCDLLEVIAPSVEVMLQ